MVQGVEARGAAEHFPRHFPRHRAALPAENPQPPVALVLSSDTCTSLAYIRRSQRSPA